MRIYIFPPIIQLTSLQSTLASNILKSHCHKHYTKRIRGICFFYIAAWALIYDS